MRISTFPTVTLLRGYDSGGLGNFFRHEIRVWLVQDWTFQREGRNKISATERKLRSS